MIYEKIVREIIMVIIHDKKRINEKHIIFCFQLRTQSSSIWHTFVYQMKNECMPYGKRQDSRNV